MMRFARTVLLVAVFCTGQVAMGADKALAGNNKPEVLELWPGKAPDETGDVGSGKSSHVAEAGPQAGRGHRIDSNGDQRQQTQHHHLSAGQGQGHGDRDGDLPRRRLLEPLLAAGRRGGRRLAEFAGRDRRHPQVPGAAPPDEPKAEPARRPLQDAQRAVSLVRSKAKELGIAPDRIGMVGFSAGGHLAIATATSFAKRSYQPIDGIDEISCRPDFAVAVYSGYLKDKDKDELAPGLRIPRGHAADLSRARRGRPHQRSRKQRGPVQRVEARRRPGGVARLRRSGPRLRRPAQRPSLLHLDAVLRRLAAGSGISQAAVRP